MLLLTTSLHRPVCSSSIRHLCLRVVSLQYLLRVNGELNMVLPKYCSFHCVQCDQPLSPSAMFRSQLCTETNKMSAKFSENLFCNDIILYVLTHKLKAYSLLVKLPLPLNTKWSTHRLSDTLKYPARSIILSLSSVYLLFVWYYICNSDKKLIQH